MSSHVKLKVTNYRCIIDMGYYNIPITVFCPCLWLTLYFAFSLNLMTFVFCPFLLWLTLYIAFVNDFIITFLWSNSFITYTFCPAFLWLTLNFSRVLVLLGHPIYIHNLTILVIIEKLTVCKSYCSVTNNHIVQKECEVHVQQRVW